MRVVHGLISGLMAFLTLGMVGAARKHLLTPFEPHHVTRLVTDGVMALLFGYFAWAEGRRAFGRDAAETVSADGRGTAQTVGSTLVETGPELLTVRPAPKTRFFNMATYGFWLLIIALSVPGQIHRHAWGMVTFNTILGLFAVLMVTFTLLRWNDRAVWDRARGAFLRNGVPALPLAQIADVDGEKVSGVYHLMLTTTDGTRTKATPALTVYRKPEDAERVAAQVREFLALAPSTDPLNTVWPPPPTV